MASVPVVGHCHPAADRSGHCIANLYLNPMDHSIPSCFVSRSRIAAGLGMAHLLFHAVPAQRKCSRLLWLSGHLDRLLAGHQLHADPGQATTTGGMQAAKGEAVEEPAAAPEAPGGSAPLPESKESEGAEGEESKRAEGTVMPQRLKHIHSLLVQLGRHSMEGMMVVPPSQLPQVRAVRPKQ